MSLVLWASLALLAFTYAGYPLLMWAIARWRPKPVDCADHTPTVDVVLVVHDCAALLEGKLHNLLGLDYPGERLRINVIADGCTDSTESVAVRCASPRVRLFGFRDRRGKSACIGSVLPSLDAEILLFTDVRQRLEPGALKALTAALADPRVGAASGELVLETSSGGYGRGIDAYWRYEKMIRRLESASGSIIGVTGALYAARREALPAVPPGLVLDDMWIPLSIAARGFRVVSVPGAVAVDGASDNPRTEELRKRRTLAGNFQLLRLWPALALPGAHPLALRLWGHKWLRLLAPWLLLAAFASSAWLAESSPVMAVLFGLQVLAYGAAALGRFWPRPWLRWLPVRLCTAFVSLNLSAALALLDFLRNPHSHLWSTTRLEGSYR